MRNLKVFLQNPFVNSKISNENLLHCSYDHIGRMSSKNDNHLYDTPIANTQTVADDFRNVFNETEVAKALRKSITSELNTSSEALKSRIRELEASVYLKYGRGTAKFIEYFPQGLTVFGNAGYNELENLFIRLISVFQANLDDWEASFIADLIVLKNKFIELHKNQVLAKGKYDDKRMQRNEKRAILEDILFENLLNICLLFRNKPEEISVYFDQTIIRRRESQADTVLAEGSNIVSGIVSDSDDDEPIENAVVEFTDLALQTTTDEDGEYYFDQVPTGTHQMKVTYNGFETYVGNVIVSTGEEITHDITLVPFPIDPVEPQ